MTSLWFVLTFIAGFWLGTKVMRVFQKYTLIAVLKELDFDPALLKKATDKLRSQTEDDAGFIEFQITVEQHSGQLYAYRKDNDEFLAQAATSEELKEAIAQKVKRPVRLIISDEDGADFLRNLIEDTVTIRL